MLRKNTKSWNNENISGVQISFHRLTKVDVTSKFPNARLDTAHHWPSIAKNVPKIVCQYRAVSGMITLVCTWRLILAQTLAASNCFRHSYGPMLCRTLVYSLLEWFSMVKVTHGPIMCRPWARLKEFLLRDKINRLLVKLFSF